MRHEKGNKTKPYKNVSLSAGHCKIWTPFLIDFRFIQAKHSSNKTTKFVCKDKICKEGPQNGMELK